MWDPRQDPLYNTLNEFDFIVFVQLENVPYRISGQCPLHPVHRLSDYCLFARQGVYLQGRHYQRWIDFRNSHLKSELGEERLRLLEVICTKCWKLLEMRHS